LSELGIVAALAAESRPLGPVSRARDGPVSLADGSLLILSGVGTVSAAQGARQLVRSGARALISWGMAGGLDPTLAAGTLMLPEAVISPEGRLFLTTADWRQRVREALGAGHPVCGGRLLTSREALASAADKARAFRETGAVAVDMESSAIAEVAAAERLRFLAVRAIVDTAADTVPRAALAAAAPGAGAVRIGRLLGALARAPWELPALLRLAGRYRSASTALAAVARSRALSARP
jgi:adenosylhomocysteine nucleosidase